MAQNIIMDELRIATIDLIWDIRFLTRAIEPRMALSRVRDLH